MARKIYHVPNREAYDRWAATYDSDGNVLQSLDTIGLYTSLLPRLRSSLEWTDPATTEVNAWRKPLRIIDLGCGTGRSTLALIDMMNTPSDRTHSSPQPTDPDQRESHIHILGLDSSNGMLDVARSRVPPEIIIPAPFLTVAGSQPSHQDRNLTIRTTFQLYDIQAASGRQADPAFIHADAIICALVVEHLPSLPAFFSHLVSSKLLKKDGLLVLSNMHPNMAGGAFPTSTSSLDSAGVASSQNMHNPSGAGFIDPVSGNKIRAADSFAHTIPGLLDAARANGFELLGDQNVEEMRVERWMLDQGLVDARRGRKWAEGGVLCWFGAVLRLASVDSAA